MREVELRMTDDDPKYSHFWKRPDEYLIIGDGSQSMVLKPAIRSVILIEDDQVRAEVVRRRLPRG